MRGDAKREDGFSGTLTASGRYYHPVLMQDSLQILRQPQGLRPI